jgi:hypothetical protein
MTLNSQYPGKIKWFLLEEIKDFETAWERESWQRNQIGLNLGDFGVEDIVLLSDIDEIPNELFMKSIRKLKFGEIFIAKMQLFYFDSHYKSRQEWFGSIATKGKPNLSFQEFRMVAIENWKLKPEEIIECAGMHLSSIGNTEFLLNKIQGFSHAEFNTWPYNRKAFLRVIILLGISYDGSEVFSFQKHENRDFDFFCRNSHKFDFLRSFVARAVRPLIKYLFDKNVGRLSGPS